MPQKKDLPQGFVLDELDLPEDFVLDAELPAGFQMDAITPSKAAPETSSFMSQLNPFKGLSEISGLPTQHPLENWLRLGVKGVQGLRDVGKQVLPAAEAFGETIGTAVEGAPGTIRALGADTVQHLSRFPEVQVEGVPPAPWQRDSTTKDRLMEWSQPATREWEQEITRKFEEGEDLSWLQLTAALTQKVGKTIVDSTQVPDDLKGEGYFAEIISPGLGMFLGFGATRAVTGLPGLVSTAATFGRRDFYDDAKRFSDDPEIARTAEMIGTAVGATQIIPLEVFWTVGKIYNATGGKTLLRNFTQALATGVSEATLEGFYEAAKNYTAGESGLAYDPTRSVEENVREAATAGGVVGFLGSVLLSTMGLPPRASNRRTLRDAIQEFIDARAERDAAAAEMEGPVGPTREQLADIIETMMTEGRPLGEILRSLEQTAEAHAGPPTPDFLLSMTPDARVDRVSGKPSLDTPTSQLILYQLGVETVVPGQIAVAVDTRYRESLDALEQQATAYLRAIESGDLQPNLLQSMQKELARLTSLLEPARQRVADIEARRKKYLDVLQEWVRLYNPQGKYVLTFDQQIADLGYVKRSDAQLGHHSILGEGISLLDVDLVVADTFTRTEDLRGVGTLAHEFGHSLARQLLGRMPRQIQDAVLGAYHRYLRSQEKAEDTREWMDKKYPPGHLRWLYRRHGPFGPQALDRPRHTFLEQRSGESEHAQQARVDYQLSFDEFFANEIARAMMQRKDARRPVERFFRRVGEILQRFWQREHTKWDADQTFHDFLDILRIQATHDNLAQRLLDLKGQSLLPRSQTEAMTDGEFITHFSQSVTEGAKLGGPLVSKAIVDKLQNGLDKFHRLAKYGYNLVQLAKMNPHIAGLAEYIQIVREWWNEGSYWREAADNIYKDWYRLGKVQARALGEFAIDVTVESERKGRRLTDEELTAMSQDPKYKLTVEAMQLFYSIDNLFKEAIGYGFDTPRGLYQVRLEEINRLYRDDPSVRMRETRRLEEDMKQLMNRNYFPLMRFGEHTVVVRALEEVAIDGKTYHVNEVMRFEAFESKVEANARAAELKKQFKGREIAVGQGMMSDFQQSLMGLPRQFLEMLQTNLNLTDDQQAQLRDLINDASPTNSYKKHLKERKMVAGFDLDGPRIFATYFSTYSNYISKLRHMQRLEGAIRHVEESADAIKRQGGDASKRDQIASWLRHHLAYIMNPGNELAWLRGAGFTWYLGFNPKSAIVNLTQVPMIAYPYLAARKALNGSDKTAVVALLRAYKKASQTFAKEGVLNQGESLMLLELRARGIIDQSLAMELSAAREGGNLIRTLPGTFKSQPTVRALRNFSYGAAWMFHVAEKYNRRVVAIAAYDMARKAGMDHKQAVEEAYTAVETTQFEYASWNRPVAMRGKASTLFLFYMYMQNALWFGTHDPGAKRFWLVMLATAGISGLPFAEDAMELFDFLATKWKTAFGKENPRVRVREDIRHMLTTLGVDPHLAMHGLSGTYGMGPIHLLSMAGAPVPNFDISASTQLGRVIPGLELIHGEGRVENVLARGGEDIAGAAWGMPLGIYKALKDDNPDQWKRFESALPVFMGSMSRAARRGMRGYEQDASGYPILDYDVTDPLHLAELVGRGMGFEATRMRIERDRRFAQNDLVQFWETRRGMLMAQYWQALRTKDKEGIADVRKAIRKYNASIPDPAFMLTPQMLRSSMMERSKRQALSQRGLPRNLRHTRSYEELRELYPHQDERAP
jgi:hypothetical protein